MKISDAQICAARILIVDDQRSNVELLEQLLHAAGYLNVSSTMDPTTVAAAHRAVNYDLILLDLQMPLVDGFAVIEELKANESGAYLPVVVLTAQPGHRIRALSAGVRDFLSKPLDLLEVKTRIRNMLEVRLLYRLLEANNAALEETVRVRTEELRESRARYRSLAELASDWYWEQDDTGRFTRVSGPVLEMLGMRVDALSGAAEDDEESGWHADERAELKARISGRQPFLDFLLTRRSPTGDSRQYRVSGEPIFSETFRFVGYRGVGVEILAAR